MIREHLVPALRERFPEHPFAVSEDARVVSLPSPCRGVGELVISDDEDEATVYLTNVTHRHFACYDDALTPAEKEKQIASDILDFVTDLLEDRVVLWRALGDAMGGTRRLKPDQSPPRSSWLRKQFLWSRPL